MDGKGAITVKYYKCSKCGNLSVGPDLSGVEISCGAFVEYSSLDAQDALNHGVRPNFDKGLKLGDIKLNSVVSCGGYLLEITEEQANRLCEEINER